MASSNPSINSLKKLLMDDDDDDKQFLGQAQSLLGPDVDPNQAKPQDFGNQGLNMSSLLNTGPSGSGVVPAFAENAAAEVPLLEPIQPIPSSAETNEIDQNAFANVFYNGNVMTTIYANMFKTRN